MKSYLVKIEHEYKVVSKRGSKKEYPNQNEVLEINVDVTIEDMVLNDKIEDEDIAVKKAIIKLLEERVVSVGESIHVKEVLCLFKTAK